MAVVSRKFKTNLPIEARWWKMALWKCIWWRHSQRLQRILLCCLCDKTYSLQCDGGVLLIFTANIFFLSYSYDSHNSQSTFNSFQFSVISTTHKSYMHRMYRNYVSMIIMCMRYSVQQSSSCCCCWTITMMTRSKIIFIALHCIVIPPMLNFVLGKIFIIHFNLLE